MIVRDFTQEEIDYFLRVCNFNRYETPLFIMRAKGDNLEHIAEVLNISPSYARKVSQRVNRKIIKCL